VSVSANKDWSTKPLPIAIVNDGLCDGEDMVLVERRAEGAAAVAAGPKADLLFREASIWL
jgi:hypothetical protein